MSDCDGHVLVHRHATGKETQGDSSAASRLYHQSAEAPHSRPSEAGSCDRCPSSSSVSVCSWSRGEGDKLGGGSFLLLRPVREIFPVWPIWMIVIGWLCPNERPG